MSLYKVLTSILIIAFTTGSTNGLGTFYMYKKPVEKVYTSKLYTDYQEECNKMIEKQKESISSTESEK